MEGGFVLEAEGLVKRIGGVTAVRGVTFRVAPGEVYCLVGPNGAGKTTTLRMIVGLVRPDEGRVRILGRDPAAMTLEERRAIAYLPEEAGVYRNLTGLEYLWFVASLYAGSREEAERMVERGAEISGLGEALRRRAGGDSKGMKRRLALAAALMVEPRLAVLDEPTAGLDVAHAVAVRRAIRGYVDSTGAAAVVSSHNMLEVEYLCDRVGLMSGGVIVEEGRPRELVERHGASNLEEVFVAVAGGVA